MFKKASGHLNGAPLTGWSTAKPTKPNTYAGANKPSAASAYARQRRSFLKKLLERASEPELPSMKIPTVLQTEIASAGGLQAWAERELPRFKAKADRLTWVLGGPKKKKRALRHPRLIGS